MNGLIVGIKVSKLLNIPMTKRLHKILACSTYPLTYMGENSESYD